MLTGPVHLKLIDLNTNGHKLVGDGYEIDSAVIDFHKSSAVNLFI